MAEFQNWNLGGNILAGYERGRQIGRDDKFRQLASQAVSANPTERDALLSQAVAVDPTAGFELGERLNKDQDRRQTQLYNMARGFDQIHKANPAAAASFYTNQIAPGLKRLGFDVSDQYNEAEVLPVVQQVLAAYGGGQGDALKSLSVGANGNFWAIRGNDLVDTGVPAAPQTTLIDQPGQVPFFAVSGRGPIGQTIGIGGQAQPAAQPPAQTYAGAQGGVTTSPQVVTNQQGERGRYSIGQDGLPVFIAEGVAPNVEQGIVADPAAFQQPTAQAPAQFVGGSAPAPVRNPTAAENAAATATASTEARIQAERGLQRPQELASDEQAFRKELDAKLDEPRTVLTAYQRVQAAAQNPSAANDLALIFGYMKMLDPGSVVREGEFANAQNSGGIPDRIWNAYNRALNGERLNPEQRQAFVQSADQQAEIARNKVNTEIKRAQTTARQYQYDPERATGSPDFSGVTATPLTGGATDQPQPKTIRYDARGNRLP